MRNMMLLVTLFSCSCVTIGNHPRKYNRYHAGYCRIICYNWDKLEEAPEEACGPKFKKGNYHLKYCDGVIGIDINRYAEDVRPDVLTNIKSCQSK